MLQQCRSNGPCRHVLQILATIRPQHRCGAIELSLVHRYSLIDAIARIHIQKPSPRRLPVSCLYKTCQRNFHGFKQAKQRNDFFHEPSPRRQNHSTSDPTAKRPTKKCDPYGLAGKSLPYTECLNLLSTLESGWRLFLFETQEEEEEEYDVADIISNHNQHISRKSNRTPTTDPIFLQKYYFHPTFHDASKFISQISLLATNTNHFPQLSIERILAKDVNDNRIYTDAVRDDNETFLYSDRICNEDTENGAITTRKMDEKVRKTKKTIQGWIFRSTIRCSTYRPLISVNTTTVDHPSPSPPKKVNDANSGLFLREVKEECVNRGLTYHDFHLAMSIDVEVNREDVKRWLMEL